MNKLIKKYNITVQQLRDYISQYTNQLANSVCYLSLDSYINAAIGGTK